MECAGGHLFGVAQTSKSAMSRVSKPARGHAAEPALPLPHRQQFPASIPSAADSAPQYLQIIHFRENVTTDGGWTQTEGRLSSVFVRVRPCSSACIRGSITSVVARRYVASAYQANPYMSNSLRIHISRAFPAPYRAPRSKISLFPEKSHKLLAINNLEPNMCFPNQTQSSLVKPNRACSCSFSQPPIHPSNT
jgi:hypothetical protein